MNWISFRLSPIVGCVTTTFAATLAGLGLGLSLIIAIGAQNVFVLRQGLRREHILAVVLVCALSDIALIALGIAGLGALIEQLPGLITVVRWLGAAFLIGYGLLAARRALRADKGLDVLVEEGEEATLGVTSAAHAETGATTASLAPATSLAVATKRIGASTSLRTTVLTVLALTWLNPHVYLDTVFLLGSIANSHGDDRWAFGIGAAIASIVWFTALGFGARLLGRLLRTATAWRVFDGLIAVLMVSMGVLLVVGH